MLHLSIPISVMSEFFGEYKRIFLRSSHERRLRNSNRNYRVLNSGMSSSHIQQDSFTVTCVCMCVCVRMLKFPSLQNQIHSLQNRSRHKDTGNSCLHPSMRSITTTGCLKSGKFRNAMAFCLFSARRELSNCSYRRNFAGERSSARMSLRSPWKGGNYADPCESSRASTFHFNLAVRSKVLLRRVLYWRTLKVSTARRAVEGRDEGAGGLFVERK